MFTKFVIKSSTASITVSSPHGTSHMRTAGIGPCTLVAKRNPSGSHLVIKDAVIVHCLLRNQSVDEEDLKCGGISL